jgi:hypothetical protein
VRRVEKERQGKGKNGKMEEWSDGMMGKAGDIQ